MLSLNSHRLCLMTPHLGERMTMMLVLRTKEMEIGDVSREGERKWRWCQWWGVTMTVVVGGGGVKGSWWWQFWLVSWCKLWGRRNQEKSVIKWFFFKKTIMKTYFKRIWFLFWLMNIIKNKSPFCHNLRKEIYIYLRTLRKIWI